MSSVSVICRYNATAVKIPASYFVGVNKVILELMWRGKEPE